MMWIILLLIGGATAFFAIRAYKAGQSSVKGDKAPKALPNKGGPRGLLNLQINDIVTHFTTTYMVEGKLVYNDDGSTWVEYYLDDGDNDCWLSVEEDDRLEVAIFREVEDLKFTSRPPEHIEYDGVRYELEEWGRAKVERTGSTGNKSGLSCTYYEYEAPGGRYMTVEQWGEGSFEVSVGQAVRPNELEVLPGDDVTNSFA